MVAWSQEAGGKLTARLHSQQLFDPDEALTANALRITTNRVFELDGTEITGAQGRDPANELAIHLFEDGAVSPVDCWTLELRLVDKKFLRSVTQ